jgi:DNA-binding response OmpR family regulator
MNTTTDTTESRRKAVASKLKALVIDDDRGIVTGVQMRLAHAGFEVITSFDGVEGLSRIKSENPDIVLCDVQMPRMDGLTVLRELRNETGTTNPPVIMLSASLQDQRTALDAGAQYFLTKPYRSADLLDAVWSILTPRLESV